MGNEICVGIENQEKEESKKSLKYFDRDCEAKQEILTVSLNHPNGLKLNQLYNLCDYKGKLTTFKSNLSKYANGAVTENGRRIIKPELQYVNRIGKRGSYRYILNDNGVQKAINDPLYYRRKQREEHEEWENQYIQHHFVNTEGDGSHSIQVVEKPVGRDLGDENDRPADDKSDETTDKLNVVELKRQLAEKDSTIEKLKDEKSDLEHNLQQEKGKFTIVEKTVTSSSGKSTKSTDVKYHSVLVEKVGQEVSEDDFDQITHRFVRMLVHKNMKDMVFKVGQIRLMSKTSAGSYVKNKDAEYVEFAEMTKNKPLYLACSPTSNGVGFYYTRNPNNPKAESYDIKELTLTEYNKVVNKLNRTNSNYSGFNRSNKRPINNRQRQVRILPQDK